MVGLKLGSRNALKLRIYTLIGVGPQPSTQGTWHLLSSPPTREQWGHCDPHRILGAS